VDLVVDIGSNDGILLKPFRKLGLDVLGVEPATNLAEKCNANGLPTINEFFNVEVAKRIATNDRKAQLITCNNCFAHIDNLHEILDGVKELLAPDGTFIFENAYLLDTINNCYFDQVYHEHIFYHSIKPLDILLKNHGLELYHIERNDIQGGTIRCFVRKANGQWTNWQVVEDLITQEEAAGLYSHQNYIQFKEKIDQNKDFLIEYLKDFKRQGKRICAYSWPAKATTLTSYYDIGYFFDFVVEDAKAKQNKWTPKFNLPIFDKSKLVEADCAVILAWNFGQVIIENNPDFREKWIIPLPETEIIINGGTSMTSITPKAYKLP
jgi:SAM-dependent methyltransferase